MSRLPLFIFSRDSLINWLRRCWQRVRKENEKSEESFLIFESYSTYHSHITIINSTVSGKNSMKIYFNVTDIFCHVYSIFPAYAF